MPHQSTNTIERHKSCIRGEGVKNHAQYHERKTGYKQKPQKVQIPGA
jgi:hypothetical protein